MGAGGYGKVADARALKNADETMSVVRLGPVEDAPNVLIVPMPWLPAVLVKSSYPNFYISQTPTYPS